jgi:hypothetical protein
MIDDDLISGEVAEAVELSDSLLMNAKRFSPTSDVLDPIIRRGMGKLLPIGFGGFIGTLSPYWLGGFSGC